MTVLRCDVEDVLGIAATLQKADLDIRLILTQLDVAILEKGAGWSGDSQRYFMQFFREWRRGMDIQSVAVRQTVKELRRATEEYRKMPVRLE